MIRKMLCAALALIMTLGGSVTAIAKEDDSVAQEVIYVDPSGENGAFKTIAEAKDYARTLPRDGGDIVIEIAPGTYELEETLVFEPEDGGSDGCTVIYRAGEGGDVILSGGKTISGEWRDEGNGVYSIEYERGEKLRSLYVNGKRRYMTSKTVKAKGEAGEYTVKKGSADWAWADGTAADGVILPNDAISLDTRNPEDIELMTQTRWNTTIVCVDRIEKHGLNICARFQMPYGAFAQTLGWGNEYQFKENNMIYNIFEELDEPGEFYYDKAGARLYYIPYDYELLNTAEVVAPELETLVEIKGRSLEDRVTNLRFEGITFAYTDFNLFEADGSHGRATNQGAAALTAYAEQDWHGYIYRAYDVGPAAVTASSAKGIGLDGCTVCHTGNDGISLVNDVVNSEVTASVIIDTGGSALLIGHPQHEYIGDRNSGKGNHSDKEKYSAEEEGVCTGILIKNNLFKDTSRLFWGAAGVMVYIADSMQFLHNQVENTTYSGLSLGWGWWNMNGDSESVLPGEPSVTMKNNIIKYNYFKNTITTLSDAGAIYTIGDMPGTQISENYIDTVGSEFSNNAYHIRGIHIDEGTRNVYGEKNVIDIDSELACIDCGDWGKKGDNVWDNNYSTAESYTTTESYEPGTKITNAHYVPDENWDETAKAVIENAGIEDEALENIPPEYLNSEQEIIKAIEEYKPNIAAIVCACVVGAAALAGAAAAVIIKIKRKKRGA